MVVVVGRKTEKCCWLRCYTHAFQFKPVCFPLIVQFLSYRGKVFCSRNTRRPVITTGRREKQIVHCWFFCVSIFVRFGMCIAVYTNEKFPFNCNEDWVMSSSFILLFPFLSIKFSLFGKHIVECSSATCVGRTNYIFPCKRRDDADRHRVNDKPYSYINFVISGL